MTDLAQRSADYNQRVLDQFSSGLERARRRKNLSRMDLATKAGIHYDTLRRLEEEPERYPRLDTAVAIANALDIKVTSLINPKED